MGNALGNLSGNLPSNRKVLNLQANNFRKKKTDGEELLP
jgi:hypothetical protein